MQIYKIAGWFAVILGSLTVYGSISETDGAAGVCGGFMFAGLGALVIHLVKLIEKK